MAYLDWNNPTSGGTPSGNPFEIDMGGRRPWDEMWQDANGDWWGPGGKMPSGYDPNGQSATPGTTGTGTGTGAGAGTSGGTGTTTGVGSGASIPSVSDLVKQWTPQSDPNAGRNDALWSTLMDRAKQSLVVDRNNPVIRAQADAYSANEERGRRNYISDTAERQGPLANIQGERRMAAERSAQRSGAFEAQLMGQELSARRAEIAQALAGAQGMLSADQTRQLQQQLGLIDAALRSQGQSQSYDLGLRSNDLGLRNLGLQDWDRQQYWDMVRMGLI